MKPLTLIPDLALAKLPRLTMLTALPLMAALALMTGSVLQSPVVHAQAAAEAAEAEPEKGPHRGRMLRDGDFALELAIFETGVPPEFRVWTTLAGNAIAPQDLQLTVRLIRLGDGTDTINFRAEGDYLRGDMEIYEPHSFVVDIQAEHAGKQYHWSYDNFEGRTQIADPVAEAMGIATETAGPATLHIQTPAWGTLTAVPGSERNISARFDGEIRTVHVREGQAVQAGTELLTIESNESLKTYVVRAPSAGTVSHVNSAAGEQTAGRTLLTLQDNSSLQAELAVYPKDWSAVKRGAPVSIHVPGTDLETSTTLTAAYPEVQADQSRLWRATVDNRNGQFAPGMRINANIETETRNVELAVKRSGLQAFRDFTVVYAKVGDQYEVRMLELGQAAGEWIEVLGGLTLGTEYVTENSFIIKADIEKSGASHDH
ncbi:efflux RND transporter periplasmic adaptor subunit [uncultured Thalassolituus sp.]|uniref:efflux RND transporter periplasmic adaptor subunit n=1 Tax=uncultured Thalassolituus sp. TaxID=285273 RepID=UPI00262B758C|nr:HlyD family efflux transporter periplasmic adaptor subunit [uncultured Thalassolituus sp.]